MPDIIENDEREYEFVIIHEAHVLEGLDAVDQYLSRITTRAFFTERNLSLHLAYGCDEQFMTEH